MTHPTDRKKGFEARQTSHTRFGPRPVPKTGKRPHVAKLTHQRDWPKSSLTSKILVWGGMGVMAAAATAGAVLATRKVADMITGDEPKKPQTRKPQRNPRFAQLDDDEQDAIQTRVRARAMQDRKDAARTRAAAAQGRAADQGAPRRGPSDRPRRKPKKSSFVSDLTKTAGGLTSNLTSLVGAIQIAMTGFRSVSSQAGGIVREFSDAAESVRGFLGEASGGKPKADSADKASERGGDRARRG